MHDDPAASDLREALTIVLEAVGIPTKAAS
jgi:hypothetical protein